MAGASYIQSSFIGGLVSKFTQGRYHDQHYRTWLETCLNGFPTETEAWVRRPGFGLAGTTRRGLPARLIKFDFQANAPYTMEFSSLFMRFWQANQLATTNDAVGLSAISAATPAHITLASAVTWATGDEIFFTGLGTTCPTLQNRRFTITKIDTTHFTLADAVTQTAFNGAGVGTPAAAALVNHVLEITTPYNNAALPALRSVQTDQASFLLHGSFQPQQLTVDTNPTGMTFATFTLAPSLFEDGPYLDPFTNGVQAVPNQLTGLVQITLQFPQYVATTSYAKGDFVTSSSVNYVSLVDQNVGNTPVSSPSDWQATNAAAAINAGSGFLASDIGRLVRLFSEPAPWAAGTTYAAGAVVSYNPTGLPGASTYWQSLVGSNTGNVPGADAQNVTGATIIMHWAPCAPGAALPSIDNVAQSQAQASGPAQWTWGAIVSLLNFISGTVSGVAHFGTMTSGGGLSSAFDGNLVKASGSCAELGTSFNPPPGSVTSYVGQNYSGTVATAYKIQSVTIVPSTDAGFCSLSFTGLVVNIQVTASLYASNSAPSSFNNGTLLGTATIYSNGGALTSGTYALGTNSITIDSSDQSTAYAYVWVVIQSSVQNAHFSGATGSLTNVICQMEVVQAGTSATSSNGCTVELLGPPLLYTNPIVTWQLGLYSNTTGWPSVGTYAEGRLWLSGAVPNRIDACVANGINGVNNGQQPGSVNFAPTDQYGNVTAASAIDYTFNAPDANPILWMIPDLAGVLCGTKAGEWIVQAPASGGIAPTNIVARRATTIGCANIEPRRAEHTIIFVQKFLQKIMEYFADVFSGKFTAPNLTKDAKQLTALNVQEIAYQQELTPIIWARVNNGLIGSTYKRDTLMTSSGPSANGWHQHALGSGRQLESIVVGSSVNGTLDALMAVTNNPTANVRFVEVLSSIQSEGTLQSAAQYLDAAIAPSSTSFVAASGSLPYGGITLNGLWNLNGSTVTAWLGGLDCGDYTVANGSITVPFGDGIANGQGSFPASSGANRGDQGLLTHAFCTSGVTANGVVMFSGALPALVGFTYTSQGRIVRPNAPAESGARSGPAFGKWRRSQWIMGQFEGSQGVSWGTNFNDLFPVPFPQFFGGPPMTIDQQFSGITRDNVQADYTFDNRLAWQVTRPFICNVQTIGAALETQDI